MKKSESRKTESSQVDKFREAARELETDQSEEAFERVLKEVVKSPVPKDVGNPKNKRED